GAGRPQERADLEAALVQAGLARRVRVMADGEVALSTAFADGAGIIVSAGTGSIAYARDPAGQLHRAGGYGWQLGDEGGGYWLGRRALDGGARAADGRAPSRPPPAPGRTPAQPRGTVKGGAPGQDEGENAGRSPPPRRAHAKGGARSRVPARRQKYAAARGTSRPRPPAPLRRGRQP